MIASFGILSQSIGLCIVLLANLWPPLDIHRQECHIKHDYIMMLCFLVAHCFFSNWLKQLFEKINLYINVIWAKNIAFYYEIKAYFLWNLIWRHVQLWIYPFTCSSCEFHQALINSGQLPVKPLVLKCVQFDICWVKYQSCNEFHVISEHSYWLITDISNSYVKLDTPLAILW